MPLCFLCVSISIENLGVGPAEDILFNLTTNDPYINIIDGVESLNNLGVNQTITLENGFSVDVSSNIPNDYDIECLLVMNSNDNGNCVKFISILAL